MPFFSATGRVQHEISLDNKPGRDNIKDRRGVVPWAMQDQKNIGTVVKAAPDNQEINSRYLGITGDKLP